MQSMSKCEQCSAGTWQNDEGATKCDACPRGSFCPRGASAPLPCKEGSHSSATNLQSAARCVPTDPGSFAPTGSTVQTACAAGTIAPMQSMSKCEQCSAGTWQNDEGATKCAGCPRGSFCPRGTVVPLSCEGGSFSNKTNLASATQCTVAAPGHFSQTASVEQRRCRPDTYNPDSGQSSDVACVSCSRNSTTNGRDGQTSISACICIPEFFEQNMSSKWDTGKIDCRPCIDVHETSTIAMTNCSAAGATLNRLPLLSGNWRQSASSRIVRACDDQSVCVGGDEPGDASCATGHSGPLCDLCKREPLYYGGRGNECKPCSEAGDPTMTIAVAISGTVSAFVMIVALGMFFKRRALRVLTDMVQVAASTSNKKTSVEAVEIAFAEECRTQATSKDMRLGRLLELAGRLGVKARILISLAQVLSQVATTYDITFPELYNDVLSTMGRVSVPIKFLPFGCIVPTLDNFMFDLVLQTATPLLLMLVLELINKVLKARNRRHSAGKPAGLIVADLLADINFFIGFIVYPSVSTAIFMFFMEETFDGPGEDGLTVMRYDRSIETASSLYTAFVPYALVMLVVYPIGLPLQYALLLFRNRDELRELRHMEMTIEAEFALAKLDAEAADGEEQVAEMMRKAEDAHDQRRAKYAALRAKLPTVLKKLTAGYELRCYWFEIFECGRKIALVCLPVFFSPGSSGQLILGLVICFLTCKPAFLRPQALPRIGHDVWLCPFLTVDSLHVLHVFAVREPGRRRACFDGPALHLLLARRVDRDQCLS